MHKFLNLTGNTVPPQVSTKWPAHKALVKVFDMTNRVWKRAARRRKDDNSPVHGFILINKLTQEKELNDSGLVYFVYSRECVPCRNDIVYLCSLNSIVADVPLSSKNVCHFAMPSAVALTRQQAKKKAFSINWKRRLSRL